MDTSTELAHLLPDTDENVAWMTFLNSDGDDSDEVLQNAFNEAKHEACRGVQPRDDPEGPDGDSFIAAADCDVETAATCGSAISSEQSSVVEASFPVESDLRTAVPSMAASEYTAKGPSCLPTIFEGSEFGTPRNSAEIHPELPSNNATPHHQASIIAQPSESGSSEVARSRFKFAQPERFVGRLAKSPPPVGATPLVQLSVHAPPRGRGRPRKKTTPGRTNIRTLPDYDSDPIDD